MKKLIAIVLFAVCAVSCRATAVYATPAELKAVPQSQSVALEVAIEKIEANDPAWTTPSGDIVRDALLALLRADKGAWDQLDRFYNGDGQ